MNEKIIEYLQTAKKEELIKRGLYETKYYNSDEITQENESNYYYDIKENKYFEEIPYEVTDEEYNEIIKTTPIINKEEQKIIMPSIFYFIGTIIIIIGAIAGLVFGHYQNSGYEFFLGIGTFASAFISGMIFIGFGKIIDLLNDIKNK
jgi:hypothetical protein